MSPVSQSDISTKLAQVGDSSSVSYSLFTIVVVILIVVIRNTFLLTKNGSDNPKMSILDRFYTEIGSRYRWDSHELSYSLANDLQALTCSLASRGLKCRRENIFILEIKAEQLLAQAHQSGSCRSISPPTTCWGGGGVSNASAVNSRTNSNSKTGELATKMVNIKLRYATSLMHKFC